MIHSSAPSLKTNRALMYFMRFFVAAGESHWMRIIGSNIGIKERFSRRAKVIWKKGNDSARGIAVAVRVS